MKRIGTVEDVALEGCECRRLQRLGYVVSPCPRLATWATLMPQAPPARRIQMARPPDGHSCRISGAEKCLWLRQRFLRRLLVFASGGCGTRVETTSGKRKLAGSMKLLPARDRSAPIFVLSHDRRMPFGKNHRRTITRRAPIISTRKYPSPVRKNASPGR